MKDKETGSLSEKPFLDLLLDFYNERTTGSLKLERPPLQKAVYFRDGQILFAASNDPKDQLASILVEEGKLGQEQMQVAQARVGPGSPLAKVLTELGYISQRELTDAARLKVEKILTDLYSWSDGSYQFATKSLPKGAIDLDLSTPQVILNSMRRIQDRQWVLDKLGSLEAILAPGIKFDSVLVETQDDTQAAEIIRLADGTRTIKDIAANVVLGEFEVCKILSAAYTLGALERQTVTTIVPDSSPVVDAFDVAIQPEEPSLDGASINPTEIFEVPPPAVPAAPVEVDAQSDTTIFGSGSENPLVEASVETPASFGGEPAAEAPTSTFDFAPNPTGDTSTQGIPRLTGDMPPPFPPNDESPQPSMTPPSFESLNIHEPEPDEEGEELFITGETEPARGALPKLLGIGLVVGALAGLGAATYFFVWPIFFGNDAATSRPVVEAPPKTASRPPGVVGAPTTPSPTQNPTGSTETPTGANPAPATTSATESTSPETPPRPRPIPRTPPSTTTAAAPQPQGSSPSGSTSGRELLSSGNLSRAARAFANELTSSSDKFTIAVGLYCNEENAARTVQTAQGASQLYLLPAQINGQACYRVLWGLFDTRESAVGAMASVPSAIRSGDSTPVPVAQFLR